MPKVESIFFNALNRYEKKKEISSTIISSYSLTSQNSFFLCGTCLELANWQNSSKNVKVESRGCGSLEVVATICSLLQTEGFGGYSDVLS